MKLDNYKVTQSNDLIEATYSMSNNEIRVFEACVCQVDSKSKLEENDVFTITVEEAQDLFYTKANERNAFRDLEKACDKLLNRTARIQLSEKKYLKTNFVQSVEFDPDAREVRIRFAYDLIPYISQLSAAFTSYKLKYTTKFESRYSHRLYHLVVMWLGQKKHSPIEIDINEFRTMFGIIGYENNISMFRAKVLEPAISEINQFSDCTVDVSMKKKGKKVESLQISFSRSKKAEKEIIDARKAHNEREQEKEEKVAKSAFNQEMKRNREQEEQLDMFEKNKREELDKLLQIFHKTPNGTKFMDNEGNSWDKEENGLYCPEKRYSMALKDSAVAIQKFKS